MSVTLDTEEKLEAYSLGMSAGASIERMALDKARERALGIGILIGSAIGTLLTVLFLPLVASIVR